MKEIYYNGQVLPHVPTIVPAIQRQPLANGVAYTVSNELAKVLLERAEWDEAPGPVKAAVIPPAPWAFFVEIEQVNESIAEALWNAGYESRDDVRRGVEVGGLQVLKGVSGIGDARAQIIADWAQEEESE